MPEITYGSSIGVRVSNDLAEKVAERARHRGVTVAELVRGILLREVDGPAGVHIHIAGGTSPAVIERLIDAARSGVSPATT